MRRKIVVLSAILAFAAVAVFAGGVQGEASQQPSGQPWAKPLAAPILWYLRASTADTEDIAVMNKALNVELAKQGFNAGVKVEVINRPDYNTKMNLINSSREKYDLALVTEGWVNLYPQNVENEFLVPLSAYANPKTGKVENLLVSWAPGLWKSIPPETWEAARIKGEIYAVINPQIYVKPFGVSIREDVMKALELQPAINALKSWEDLTAVMDRILKAIQDGSLKGRVENGANLQTVFSTCDLVKPENYRIDILAGSYGVEISDKALSIIDWYATSQFAAAAKLRKLWRDRGYTTKDELDAQSQINGYKAGQWVVDVGRLIKPGGALEQQARMGYSWYEKPIATPFVATSGPTGTLTGVSSGISADPDRVHAVMKLLDIVHTDVVIYNLIAKGVEGVHWNWVDRNSKVISLVESSKYRPNVDWAIGNQFNAYYVDPKQVGAWAETAALNKSAVPSVALGFRFDTTAVKTELTNIATVVKEYGDPLVLGLATDVDSAIKTLRDNMEKAGAGAIRAELERQLASWKGSRKK